MTERVYKFMMALGDWTGVTMPDGAVPLSVQMQHGNLCMWARCKPGNPPTTYHFRIAGTGHELGSNVGRHIGTVQMEGGSLVIHVFADAFEQANTTEGA